MRSKLSRHSDILPEEIRMLKASRSDFAQRGDSEGVRYCNEQLQLCGEPAPSLFSRVVSLLFGV